MKARTQKERRGMNAIFKFRFNLLPGREKEKTQLRISCLCSLKKVLNKSVELIILHKCPRNDVSVKVYTIMNNHKQ